MKEYSEKSRHRCVLLVLKMEERGHELGNVVGFYTQEKAQKMNSSLESLERNTDLPKTLILTH